MEFGKKYRVGNYYMIKVNRSLSGLEQAELRSYLPEELKKDLHRRSLPYIRISTVSGSWAIEFSLFEKMFQALDGATAEELRDRETMNLLHNLFTGFHVDTTIMGDKEYNQAKSSALQSFLERKAKEMKPETEEDKKADDAILDEMKSDMEKEDAMMRMAKEVADGE